MPAPGKAPTPPPTAPQRRRSATPLGRLVDGLASRCLAQRHRLLGQLWHHWPQILGPDLATQALPDRVSKGRDGVLVLHLRCLPGTALVLHHDSAQVLQRIAAALGPGVVGALRIHGDALLVPPAPPVSRPPPPPRARRWAESQLGAIADPELRRALAALGAQVAEAHKRATSMPSTDGPS